MSKILSHSPLMIVLLLVAMLSSCSSNEFKIDGNIANLNDGVVRIVFHGDSSIVDELIDLDEKGRFSFKGVSAQPVVVNLLDSRGNPLTAVVAANGDHIKVKGDADKASGIKVRGNRLNEDWQLFRNEHAAFYSDPNPSRLDAAIAKYVKEHPADMLSTVLLMVDYSDYSNREAVDKMLQSIDEKARPKSLLEAYESRPAKRRTEALPRLMTLNLVKHGGDFEHITLTNQVTLLHLWANPFQNRVTTVNKMKGLSPAIHVVDVLTESDTLRWQQAISADPASWKHYWAPGGPLEPGIQLLGISMAPWFAVIDSTGLVTYSGPDYSTVERELNAALDPMKKTR